MKKTLAVTIILVLTISFPIVVLAAQSKQPEQAQKYTVLWQDKQRLMLNSNIHLQVAGDKLVYMDEYKLLVCLSLADGSVAWTRQMDRSKSYSYKSISDFLLLYQNNSIMRIDSENGKTLWEIQDIANSNNAGLHVYKKSYIVLKNNSEKSVIARIDLKLGKILWEMDFPYRVYTSSYEEETIASNFVVYGSDKIFIFDAEVGSIMYELPLNKINSLYSSILYKDEKLYFVTGHMPQEVSLGFRFVSVLSEEYWLKFNCYDLKTNTITWFLDFDVSSADVVDRGSPQLSFFGDYVRVYGAFVNIKTKQVVGDLFNDFAKIAYSDGTDRYYSYIEDKDLNRVLLYRKVGDQKALWEVQPESKGFIDIFGKKYILRIYHSESETIYKLTCHDAANGVKLWSTDYPNPLFVNSFPSVMGDGSFIFYSYDSPAETQSLVCLDLATGKARWKVDQYDTPKNIITLNEKIFSTKGKKMFCVDAESRKSLWTFVSKKDICSITPYKDSIVLLNNIGGISLINSQDGSVSWTKSLREKPSRNQIFIIEDKIYSYYVEKGDPQSTFHIFALDADDGKEIEAYNYKGECFAFGRDLVFSDWFTKRQSYIGSKYYTFFGYDKDLVFVEVKLDNQEQKFVCFNWENGEKVWEKNDAKSFKALKKGVVNGRFYLASADGFLCCDALTGKTLWEQKNQHDYDSDLDKMSLELDEKGNAYRIESNYSGDFETDKFRTVQCIDGKSGQVSYTYLAFERPTSISVHNGIVLIPGLHSTTCLKDLNYTLPVKAKSTLPYPYLLAAGLLLVVMAIITVTFCISKKRRRPKEVFTKMPANDKKEP